MAEHIRATIRKAIAAQLAAAEPALKIFSARSRPAGLKSPGELLEILVPRERAATQGAGGGEYSREIDVLLVGYFAATNDDAAADGADMLALRVETAIHADQTLGGKVMDCWMTGTDFALDPATYSNASFAISITVLTTKSIDQMNL